MEEALKNLREAALAAKRIRRPKLRRMRIIPRSVSDYVVSGSTTFCLPIKVAAFDLVDKYYANGNVDGDSQDDSDDDDDHGFVRNFSAS